MSVESRLERVEARLEIGELPVRYAQAVDARDLVALAALWVEDVDCGRMGRGRPALEAYMGARLEDFYRTAHLVCGHTVDFDGGDRATGVVYGRAEHEDGDSWVVMLMAYHDVYRREHGRWCFESRRPKVWYACDVVDRPSGPAWVDWAKRSAVYSSDMPGSLPSWSAYWDSVDEDRVASVTRFPTPGEDG